MVSATLVSLEGVSVTLDGRPVVRQLDWQVRSGEHWVVIGPNGSGKSTLVKVAGLQLHPTTGRVTILDHELGRTDIRSLRSAVGLASAGLADQLRGRLTAEEVVRCGRTGALEPWWHTYGPADHEAALGALRRVGLDGYAPRTFATLSSGERQRTLLARALVNDPQLVLLDEPTAGLDLAGREELVGALVELAADPAAPATVLITHHVEDVPPSATHLLALRDGAVLASGPIEDNLNSETMSAVFDLAVDVEPRGGRYTARARP